MSSIVELQALRSQSITIRLDGLQVVLKVYEAAGGMAFDLTRENIAILKGARIVGGTPLIPYEYLQTGNYMLIINDESLPDFNKFGTTQQLIYFTQEEIEAFSGI